MVSHQEFRARDADRGGRGRADPGRFEAQSLSTFLTEFFHAVLLRGAPVTPMATQSSLGRSDAPDRCLRAGGDSNRVVSERVVTCGVGTSRDEGARARRAWSSVACHEGFCAVARLPLPPLR